MKGSKYLQILLYEIENTEAGILLEGPREIMENIVMYRQPFYDYIEKNCYGRLEEYDFIDEFVEYLNMVVLADTYKKVRIVDRNIPMGTSKKAIII